eukprot:CAMPEP_0119034136 /NCGR_PEP_ID=MMETSP1177-20130426/1167_1 /TAXON_ID=2985 /ORGANISM="Ochromonas sp, Strain CCMP1899" /LENGTH=375 /DNA_ID=CAMNT_0006991379 /DNA_START=362 /DNA_END=1489 /DNA_ORIENTATION=-
MKSPGGLGQDVTLLSLPLVRFYMASVIETLAHLHKHDIVYRNLKPENILIDQRGFIRLIGFGFAKKLPFLDDEGVLQCKSCTLCGTAEYMAPEMVLMTGHSLPVDIWALGCLFYELLTGSSPEAHYGESMKMVNGRRTFVRVHDYPARVLLAVAQAQSKGVTIPYHYQNEMDGIDGCTSLLQGLLNPIVARRTSLASVKESTAVMKNYFFSGLDWKGLRNMTIVPPYIPPPPLKSLPPQLSEESKHLVLGPTLSKVIPPTPSYKKPLDRTVDPVRSNPDPGSSEECKPSGASNGSQNGSDTGTNGISNGRSRSLSESYTYKSLLECNKKEEKRAQSVLDVDDRVRSALNMKSSDSKEDLEMSLLALDKANEFIDF